MENASKALIMAGGILIALVIIGTLVVSYKSLSQVKQEEMTAAEIEQVAEFNKSLESYNRDSLYGNDVISVINKVENYNKTESNEKGYVKIEMRVSISNEVVGTDHFKAKTYSYTQIRDNYLNLSNKIDNLLSKKYNGRDVSYYQGLTSEQLDSEIQEMKDRGISINEGQLREDVNEYELYSTVLKEFKKKIFDCTDVQYDKKTGRINLLYFKEK